MKGYLWIFFLHLFLLSYNYENINENFSQTNSIPKISTYLEFSNVVKKKNQTNPIILILVADSSQCYNCDQILGMMEEIYNSYLHKENKNITKVIFGKIDFNDDTMEIFKALKIQLPPAIVLYKYNPDANKYSFSSFSIAPHMFMETEKILKIINYRLDINIKLIPNINRFENFVNALYKIGSILMLCIFAIVSLQDIKRCFAFFIIVFLIALGNLPHHLLRYNGHQKFFDFDSKGLTIFSDQDEEGYLLEGFFFGLLCLVIGFSLVFLVNIKKLFPKKIYLRKVLIYVSSFLLIAIMLLCASKVNEVYFKKQSWMKAAQLYPPKSYVQGPLKNDQGNTI